MKNIDFIAGFVFGLVSMGLSLGHIIWHVQIVSTELEVAMAGFAAAALTRWKLGLRNPVPLIPAGTLTSPQDEPEVIPEPETTPEPETPAEAPEPKEEITP